VFHNKSPLSAGFFDKRSLNQDGSTNEKDEPTFGENHGCGRTPSTSVESLEKRALGLAAEDPNFTHDRNGSGASRPVQRHPHLPASGLGQSGLESTDDGEALRPDVKQVAHPDTQGDLAVKVLIEDVEALRVSDGLFLDRAVSQG
jgi:hypothetical protein